MRVLILPRYGRQAGSSRYMSYDFLPYYAAAGIQCDISPLLDDRYLAMSRSLSGVRRKLVGLGPHVLKQAITRMTRIVAASSYDAILLEKDVVPYAPFFFDGLLFCAKVPVIVQYDEPTYSFYGTARNPVIRSITKDKVERIMRRAAHVVAWNEDVRDYASALNRNVTLVSTGIDMVRYQEKETYAAVNRSIRIGWIGSPSGYPFLRMLDEVFADLTKEFDIELIVVSSEPYSAKGYKVVNKKWGIDTEVPDLRDMDIGIMPLPETAWAAGKSGCKMFQYMGVGLPVVVSPVGINGQVIQEEQNGLLARTPDEWRHQLAKLAGDPLLRQRLGQAGREYVNAHNSQASIAEKLINVLREATRSK